MVLGCDDVEGRAEIDGRSVPARVPITAIYAESRCVRNVRSARGDTAPVTCGEQF